MSPRPSVEAERREDVLRATWELITEIGYRRVRIADIAARTGTSTGIIHYYFETKEDVLDAAFRYAVEDAHRRSEEALVGIDDPWNGSTRCSTRIPHRRGEEGMAHLAAVVERGCGAPTVPRAERGLLRALGRSGGGRRP